MRARITCLAMIGGLCIGAMDSSSRAEIQYFRADLDSANEGSGGNCVDTGSPSEGTAWFALDTVTDMVSFSVVFSPLVAAENGAHIHGPASECNAAGILFPLSLGNPKTGSYGPLSGAQKTAMQNGQHYINIHSTTHGGGEIRGQLAPVQATSVCFLAMLDESQEGPGGGVCPGTGSSATGRAAFTLDMASQIVTYNVVFSNLTSAEVASHVHGPALPCFNTTPITNGTLPSGSPKQGSYAVSAAEAVAMLNELHYVNVHSMNFVDGEIRGQILNNAECVPAVSVWSLAALGLLTLTAGTLRFHRARRVTVV